MINKKYFLELNNQLISVLDNSELRNKEKIFRKNRLNVLLEKMFKEEKIDPQYVALVHEIKSFEFMKKINKETKLAEDSNSETGPDLKIENYKIECVCCSEGENYNFGILNYNAEYGLGDYNILLETVLPRITLVLERKSDKYKEYIDNRNS